MKIKVNKEEFEALESLIGWAKKENGEINEIALIIKNKKCFFEKERILNEMDDDIFLKALCYGYELDNDNESETDDIESILINIKNKICKSLDINEKNYNLGKLNGFLDAMKLLMEKEVFGKYIEVLKKQ